MTLKELLTLHEDMFGTWMGGRRASKLLAKCQLRIGRTTAMPYPRTLWDTHATLNVLLCVPRLPLGRRTTMEHASLTGVTWPLPQAGSPRKVGGRVGLEHQRAREKVAKSPPWEGREVARGKDMLELRLQARGTCSIIPSAFARKAQIQR